MLDLVLQNPAIWRGDQYAKVAVESIPTGFAELDAQLPGGGWPRAALTELLSHRQGIGQLRLLLPALARLSQDEKWLVLVAPPHQPYAPGFEGLGVNLARLVVVKTRSDSESLWAAERCLRSGSCAAVLAWPGAASQPVLRRLQLAAEEGKSFGVTFGPTRNAAHPSPAPLRIQLTTHRDRLELQILKRRGGGWAPPLSLNVGQGLKGVTEKRDRNDVTGSRDNTRAHGELVAAKANLQVMPEPQSHRVVSRLSSRFSVTQ